MFVYTCGRKVTTRTEAPHSFLGGRKPQDFVRDLLPCSDLVILYMKDHFSSSFLLDVVEDKLYVRRLENMSSAFGADSYPTHLDDAVKSTKHLCHHLRGSALLEEAHAAVFSFLLPASPLSQNSMFYCPRSRANNSLSPLRLRRMYWWSK